MRRQLEDGVLRGLAPKKRGGKKHGVSQEAQHAADFKRDTRLLSNMPLSSGADK